MIQFSLFERKNINSNINQSIWYSVFISMSWTVITYDVIHGQTCCSYIEQEMTGTCSNPTGLEMNYLRKHIHFAKHANSRMYLILIINCYICIASEKFASCEFLLEEVLDSAIITVLYTGDVHATELRILSSNSVG